MEINAYTFCIIVIFLPKFFGIIHFLPVFSGRNPFLLGIPEEIGFFWKKPNPDLEANCSFLVPFWELERRPLLSEVCNF